MPTPRKLPEAERRELSALLECDPRTLDKVMRGEPATSVVRRRIRRELEQYGILPPEPRIEAA